MNKRGSTLTTWTFTIITILTFIVILQSQVLTPMNNIYNKSFETGLDTSGLESFKTMRGTADAEIDGAEVSQTAQGLTLTSAWTVGQGIYRTIASFIDGTFIRTLVVDIMDMPSIIADVLILLIWMSLIFIIIYIFMKVVP